ncbi:MAG: alkaline phosphatase family protein [Candidatus Omnitrophica bacterium]|nr:alkaline phosphatase family protein [Candidatus Omnitrophota bacterium]
MIVMKPILYYIDPGSGLPFSGSGPLISGLLAGVIGFLLFGLKCLFRLFRRRIPQLILVVIIALIIMIVRSDMFKGLFMQDSKKVIILGMDGLEPGIVEKLMREGRLPNFSRLKDIGAYSKLHTSIPSESAVAWTSFYTGTNPGKHGIYDFIMPRFENYLPYLSLTNTRAGRGIARYQQGDAFWDIASRHRIPSTILFCPNTFPPDKIYGKMLSGMGVTDLRGTMGTFSFYTTAQPSGKKDTGGQVYYVKAEGNRINTSLLGPRDSSGSKKKDFAIPMKIVLHPEKGMASIELDNKRFELRESEWSAWTRIRFKIGAIKKVSGTCKFYLKRIGPVFELYVSAINIDPRHPAFAVSYPEDYAAKIAEETGMYSTLGMPHDTWALNENRIAYGTYLQQSDSIFSEREAIFRNELKKFSRGIFFFYFGTSDSLQHMFWRFSGPGHPDSGRGLPGPYGDVIETHYQRLDGILGEVLDGCVDNNTLVIVLSDHGFTAFRRAVHINRWLIENGFMRLKGGEKAGEEFFANVDWARTRAYSLGFGGIYINRINREREGIVYPGNDSEDVKGAIKKKLLGLKDPRTGQKVVNNVYIGKEIFQGPNTDKAPDLFIGFDHGFRASWQTALGAAPEALIEDNMKNWGGDHLVDPALVPGILLVNRKIERNDPNIVDIVPTILRFYGIEPPDDLDGRPLF